MPYAPNIQYDTSAVANGLTNAGNQLAQGWQEMKQNQLLAATATAKFEGALQSDPDILKFLTSENAPAPLASAYKKLQTGGQVGLKDAALLSTFGDTFMQEKQRKQAQQLQALQLQQAQQSQQQQEQANQRAQALAQFASGNAIPSDPQVQSSMKQALETPVGKYIAQVYNYTGRAPSQEALTEFAKTIASQQPKLNELETTTYTTTDDGTLKGKPITVTVDKRTRQPVGMAPVQLPINVLPGDEQIRVAGGKAASEAKGQADQKLLSDVTSNAELAQQGLPQINEIRKLYAKGVDTGFGQDFKTNAAAFFHSVGYPVDAAKLGDQQYMRSLTESQALAAAKQMAGQGSISENERNLLKNTVARYDNTPEANLHILNLVSAIQQRHIDMEAQRQKFMDEAANSDKPVDVAEKLKRWGYNNNVQSYLDRSAQADKVKSSAEDILKKYNVAH